ncbi:unnamed protein product [Moneuplotes crassus]|uniref:Uncharacterized protein n=1 Tax=Euplotes crassus TaxID=5936 RepID=A0AAD2DC14_EUPCR|nr:unnamed protein product [Moneuplotes crassus]
MDCFYDDCEEKAWFFIPSRGICVCGWHRESEFAEEEIEDIGSSRVLPYLYYISHIVTHCSFSRRSDYLHGLNSLQSSVQEALDSQDYQKWMVIEESLQDIFKSLCEEQEIQQFLKENGAIIRDAKYCQGIDLPQLYDSITHSSHSSVEEQKEPPPTTPKSSLHLFHPISHLDVPDPQQDDEILQDHHLSSAQDTNNFPLIPSELNTMELKEILPPKESGYRPEGRDGSPMYEGRMHGVEYEEEEDEDRGVSVDMKASGDSSQAQTCFYKANRSISDQIMAPESLHSYDQRMPVLQKATDSSVEFLADDLNEDYFGFRDIFENDLYKSGLEYLKKNCNFRTEFRHRRYLSDILMPKINNIISMSTYDNYKFLWKMKGKYLINLCDSKYGEVENSFDLDLDLTVGCHYAFLTEIPERFEGVNSISLFNVPNEDESVKRYLTDYFPYNLKKFIFTRKLFNSSTPETSENYFDQHGYIFYEKELLLACSQTLHEVGIQGYILTQAQFATLMHGLRDKTVVQINLCKIGIDSKKSLNLDLNGCKIKILRLLLCGNTKLSNWTDYPGRFETIIKALSKCKDFKKNNPVIEIAQSDILEDTAIEIALLYGFSKKNLRIYDTPSNI